ncbi:MAG: nucleoside recognition domain-containing protein [Clostridia bacterium]|nr:nucleoside recognition domain-containing protein [Clostridia bacterium]
MNKIWTFLMVVSITALIFVDPTIIVSEMTTASMGVLKLCVELLAIYTIWMGLLEIVNQSGLGAKLANLLSPIIKWLFKIEDKETIKYIALNMSSNMIGLGNASTPMGIKAMQRMDNGSGTATPAMIMLLIVNATSIQFLPTTVVGLRATAGSTTPTDIIFPTLIATILTCIVGIFLAKLCQKIFKKQGNKKC